MFYEVSVQSEPGHHARVKDVVEKLNNSRHGFFYRGAWFADGEIIRVRGVMNKSLLDDIVAEVSEQYGDTPLMSVFYPSDNFNTLQDLNKIVRETFVQGEKVSLEDFAHIVWVNNNELGEQ